MKESKLKFARRSSSQNQNQSKFTLPDWKKEIIMRNLDTFYEEAHDASTSIWNRSRYWMIIFILGLANIGDAMELGCMGFLLTNEGFIDDILGGDISKQGAIFTGSIFAGMLIGGILTGAFGDQNGRRPTLLLGLFLNSVSGFGASLAPSIFFMVICRFLGGLGIGAILSSLIPLVTEVSPSSRRGAYITVVSSFMPVGGLTVGALSLVMLTTFDLSWRLFMAACSLPSFLGFVLVYWFVPESARYLARKGQFQQATKEANHIAIAMGYHGDLLRIEELQFHSNSNSNSNSNSTSLSPTNSFNPNGLGFSNKTYKEVCVEVMQGFQSLYSPKLRRSTLLLQSMWFCLSSGSAFGTWILPIFEKVHIEHIYISLLAFWFSNVPGLLAAGALIDTMGRKKVLSYSLVCMFVSLLLFSNAAAKGAEESELPIVFTSFLFHAFMVMCWTSLNVLTSETLPTKVRSTGLGLCTASSRMAIIVCQFVDGALIETPSRLIAVSSLPILLGVFLSHFLMDTANKVLEDDVENQHQLELISISMKKNETETTSIPTPIPSQGQGLLARGVTC